MIKITQLKLSVNHSEADLIQKIKKTLRLKDNQTFTYEILKQSLDARKKPDLYYVYTIGVKGLEADKILKKINVSNVSKYQDKKYQLPSSGTEKLQERPIIIGAGPAGLFAAYGLCLAGFSSILLEQGAPMEERTKDVSEFWTNRTLKGLSNVQFGEGGAGTFSDGKLNTAVKDPSLRNPFVLDTFIQFGAPEKIRYEAKPHIGTDILAEVIVNIRKYLVDHGCEIHFHTKVEDFIIENKKIQGVITSSHETLRSSNIILAIGHSARDTFEKLLQREVPMEQKNFAVGFRVEHPQAMMNESLYGSNKLSLPAAPYKVTSNFPNGRGVYSFCMCPGGYVVNASSEENRLVVNGMSYSGRNSANANSAIIVSCGPEDFAETGVLAGMHYQRKLEAKAYQIGNGAIPQQLYSDYKANVKSSSYGGFSSCTKGQVCFGNLRGLLSEEMEASFIAGMEHFGHLITGFDREDAILSGVEARTSSPVRIIRNDLFESDITGLYPCGEGAGYAGGIMSAAMDGLKVAEAIIKKYHPN